MWTQLLLLLTSLSAFTDSYIVHDQHERLQHGRRLRIYLPKSTEKLEFIPADDPRQIMVYWDKHRHSRPIRGSISGSGNDRHWYLDQVTYDDQGTYTQKDFWDKEMSTLKVAVSAKNDFIKRIPGESLSIPLDGIRAEEASLSFSGEGGNFTLVRDGARVSQDLPDYFDRVRTHSRTIEILAVNVSDVGRYRLTDRKDRLVSVTKMDLTDHHDTVNGNPLMALLLLLGIPAGICCCCRKKIFKSKATTAHTIQTSPGAVLPPSGPTGPCPPYNQPQPGYYPPPGTDLGPSIHPPPPAPGPQWNGPPPSPGFNPAYPPQNPAYPPAGAPQWNGPPPAAGPYPGAYPPPSAPMGYAPAMYSEPPPKEEIKMEEMAPPPTEPLLAPPTQASPTAPAGAPVAPDNKDSMHTTNTAATFEIDKNSSNFL